MLRAARRGARGIANSKCPSKAALESETIIWSQDLAPGLLDPDIIVPPLLWLASERSNGVTGMRFVATRWRSDVDETEAAEGSRERAGWPSDPPLS
jgi:hypothetical protein